MSSITRALGCLNTIFGRIHVLGTVFDYGKSDANLIHGSARVPCFGCATPVRARLGPAIAATRRRGDVRWIWGRVSGAKPHACAGEVAGTWSLPSRQGHDALSYQRQQRL